MKNIFIDARLFGYFGIGTYLATLIKDLPGSKIQYTLIVRKKLPLYQEKFPQVIFDKSPFSFRGFIFFRKVIEGADLIFFPHIFIPLFLPKRVKKVATIHDLVLLSPFSHLNWMFRRFVKSLVKKVLKDFDAAVTVSDFSKKEIEKTFGSNDKVHRIHNGVAANTEKRVDLPILPENYLLCFYSKKPYKNFKLCLESFLQIRKNTNKDLHLIVIGDYKSDDSKILSFSMLPKEGLKNFYQRAKALIIPSFYEGFGLPAIEAMSAGCTVIASDIPTFKEVCQEAAFYFDPKDASSLCDAILLALDNAPLKEQKIGQGRQRVLNFSAEKMAKEHEAVFKELL